KLQINNKLYVLEGMTLRNNSGLAIVSFLIPLGLAIATVFATLALVLNLRAQELQKCRHNLLLATEEIKKGIENVLELNPHIRALQKRREYLERLRRIVANPKAILAIQIMIVQNEMLQQKVSLQQKTIIFAAEQKARARLSPLRSGTRQV